MHSQTNEVLVELTLRLVRVKVREYLSDDRLLGGDTIVCIKGTLSKPKF